MPVSLGVCVYRCVDRYVYRLCRCRLYIGIWMGIFRLVYGYVNGWTYGKLDQCKKV